MKDQELNEAARGLSFLLSTIDRKLIRSHEQQTRRIVSPLTIHVLTILSETGTSTMTELAKEIKIAKAQLTPIVDKLCESNCVRREHDPADRRFVKISITPTGVSMLHDLRNSLFLTVKSKLERLDSEDLLSLRHALDELYRIIHKLT